MSERDKAGSHGDWSEEMKVTFDSGELSSFFAAFEPLIIGDDGVPVLPTDPPSDV